MIVLAHNGSDCQDSVGWLKIGVIVRIVLGHKRVIVRIV
jgi:hypothetical protein